MIKKPSISLVNDSIIEVLWRSPWYGFNLHFPKGLTVSLLSGLITDDDIVGMF